MHRASHAGDGSHPSAARSFVPACERRPRTVPVTVLVPACNEGATLADTLISLLTQSVAVQEIVVVDDCSTDDTADIASRLGVTVIRPPRSIGSKDGAKTFALRHVQTPFVMTVNADTTFAPDAIERLIAAFDDSDVAAACGAAVPNRVRSVWERGRYIESLVRRACHALVPRTWRPPLIASECFSMYRTNALRAVGGWPTRTLAADTDLCWTFHEYEWKTRFMPDAVCYPDEGGDFGVQCRRLSHWSHGLVQNVQLHGDGMFAVRFLGPALKVAFWVGMITSAAYLFLLPVLAFALGKSWLMFGYAIEIPAVVVPVVVGAVFRGETRRAVASLPAYPVLRAARAAFFLKAAWLELVMKASFRALGAVQ